MKVVSCEPITERKINVQMTESELAIVEAFLYGSTNTEIMERATRAYGLAYPHVIRNTAQAALADAAKLYGIKLLRP